MDQIRKLFGSLSMRQRISLGVSVILVIAGIVSFLHWSRERNFKPLYSNLASEDAGAIVAKLREGGVEYRLHEADGSIAVPADKVAELRLQMATLGIPKSGRIGFELFDKTNFGTTDFAEQVNYHRAIEGELERSVMAIGGVEQARVHITFPKDSVFTDNRQSAKASVLVKLKPGAAMSTQNAGAVTQLVASAVDGLVPEAVSVLDMRGNLLLRPKKPGDGSQPSDELVEYKSKLERETLAKINSVLDPLLGTDKYRASVDIDCDLTSGEQSEENYDPSKSVITSSQRTEEGSTARESAGVPGTQSNLPRPAARPQGQGGAGLARRTENTSYETSRVVRRIKMPQGIIRRMSVSVLVDQTVRWQKTGKGASATTQKIIDPPTPERMKSIQAIVVATAGVNTTRGDLLAVETLPFEATLQAEPPASMTTPVPAKPQTKFTPVVLASIGGGVLLLVVAAFFLLRSRGKAKRRIAEMQAQLAAAQETQMKSDEMAASVNGADTFAAIEGARLDNAAPRALPSVEHFKLPPIVTTKTEILTRQVTDEARKDPAALAQIVRTWLSETSKTPVGGTK